MSEEAQAVLAIGLSLASIVVSGVAVMFSVMTIRLQAATRRLRAEVRA